jgi:hypothetical protein
MTQPPPTAHHPLPCGSMAKKTLLVLRCDLPHDVPADDDVITVTIGDEGRNYTVELCPAHADQYHATIREYLVMRCRPRPGGGVHRRPLGLSRSPHAVGLPVPSPRLCGPGLRSRGSRWGTVDASRAV